MIKWFYTPNIEEIAGRIGFDCLSAHLSVHLNKYLRGYIWRAVSVYFNGIYSVDIKILNCVDKNQPVWL